MLASLRYAVETGLLAALVALFEIYGAAITLLLIVTCQTAPIIAGTA